MASQHEPDGGSPASLGAQAPRAVRALPSTVGAASPAVGDGPASELDVARHLVLARAALPADPRDVRPPLPDLAEELDDGPGWLDGTPAPPDEDRPRPFRTRPLVPRPGAERDHGREPEAAPRADGDPVAALRGALAAMARELEEARSVARRAEARLQAPQTDEGAVPGSPAPASHPLAIEMAVAGFSRGEVGVVLSERVPDPLVVARVLDEVYGPGTDAAARIAG